MESYGLACLHQCRCYIHVLSLVKYDIDRELTDD